jgi:LPS export ABC transporter permease LptG
VQGFSPHAEIMQRHQMFSFPVACLVFAILGVAFGLHTRKEGKLGGFAMGIAVISAYYGLMVVFENLTKGSRFPAEWSRWMPDIILGLVGILAVRWRSRFAGHELTLRLPRLFRWRKKASGPTESAKPPIVLVIRIPDIQLPRPRLLDLYVGRRYLNVVTLSFFGLLAFYYIATFIDKSERLFKGQANPWMLAQYFWYSTPQFIAYIVPMAILVAVLATVGGLTRSGELVVMRSCGVSLYRAAFPLLVIALVWSAGLFVLNDRVLARANRKAESLEDSIKGLQPRLNTVASSQWRMDGDRIFYYGAFNPTQKKMFGLSVLETAQNPFRLVRHVRAADVALVGKEWVAHDGWVQNFPVTGKTTRETFDTRRMRLPPNFPGTGDEEPEMMTFGALREQIRELANSGLGLADARVTLQERIAFPLVAVVMTLLGIPFGALTGRRGALYSMGLAVILGSSYWLVNTFFLAVGQAALLPAPLAAWAANLLFLAAAGYLTLTVRT